ncbi:unnamed protein product [Haemonchus placei]|uniref:Tyrosine-protein phosphatase domain-containing protein n=1 Tax=Haemonchus placei TaxID=6290 RepID=A0A0N4WAC9_HAEPC|nr:unnamed protein product [Haemonchus placei]
MGHDKLFELPTWESFEIVQLLQHCQNSTAVWHTHDAMCGLLSRPIRDCAFNNALNQQMNRIYQHQEVLKEGDSDYFPATYACCERDDYVIMEAPTKANYRDYWRLVWRDGCKICVSLSDKLSDSDENLCYPYWPSKEGEKMQIDENRFEIECLKRNDMKGYVVYDLRITSTDPSLDTGMSKAVRGSKQKTDSREEDKNEEKKWRPLTLMHFEAWPSDTWPDLDLLGPFVHALSRREVQIMRQSVDSYVPPVVIQSHDGLGRGPVVWVSTILMKDIEKKECFDVEDLAKKCAKSRPGAFHKKIHFCVLLALAFRLASLGGWTALEVDSFQISQCVQE